MGPGGVFVWLATCASRDASAHEALVDTRLPGNRNTGHEFRDAPKGNGVIGRGLTPEERRALIAYLKTL